MSKLHLAMIWGDQADDDPTLFVDPNEDVLEQKVATYVADLWKEVMGDEPMPDDPETALNNMGGRSNYEYIDVLGYGFVKHTDLHSARMSLSDYADEIRADGKYTYDTDEELAHTESRATRIDELAKTLSEAIK